MAYAISDDCISCGACAAECPALFLRATASTKSMLILASSAAHVQVFAL